MSIGNIDTITTVIGTLVATLAALFGGLSWFVARMDKKFEAVDKRFDAIDKRFEKQEEKFDQKLDKLEQRVDAKLTDIKNEIQRVEKEQMPPSAPNWHALPKREKREGGKPYNSEKNSTASSQSSKKHSPKSCSTT